MRIRSQSTSLTQAPGQLVVGLQRLPKVHTGLPGQRRPAGLWRGIATARTVGLVWLVASVETPAMDRDLRERRDSHDDHDSRDLGERRDRHDGRDPQERRDCRGCRGCRDWHDPPDRGDCRARLDARDY